jgi:hypothetical protein
MSEIEWVWLIVAVIMVLADAVGRDIRPGV